MNLGWLSEVLAEALDAVAESRAQITDDSDRLGLAKAVWFLSCFEHGCDQIERMVGARLEELLGREVRLSGRYDPSPAPSLDAMLDDFVAHLGERVRLLELLAAELRAQALAEGPDASDIELLTAGLERIAAGGEGGAADEG